MGKLCHTGPDHWKCLFWLLALDLKHFLGFYLVLYGRALGPSAHLKGPKSYSCQITFCTLMAQSLTSLRLRGSGLFGLVQNPALVPKNVGCTMDLVRFSLLSHHCLTTVTGSGTSQPSEAICQLAEVHENVTYPMLTFNGVRWNEVNTFNTASIAVVAMTNCESVQLLTWVIVCWNCRSFKSFNSPPSNIINTDRSR